MIKYKYDELDFYVDLESGKLIIDYLENVHFEHLKLSLLSKMSILLII